MSFAIHWDEVEPRALILRYPSGWDWEALFAAQAQLNSLIAPAGRPVGVVHDMHSFDELPPQVFPNIRRLTLNAHPALHINVLIGASLHVRVMQRSFSHVLPDAMKPMRIVTAADLETARALIRQHLDARPADR